MRVLFFWQCKCCHQMPAVMSPLISAVLVLIIVSVIFLVTDDWSKRYRTSSLTAEEQSVEAPVPSSREGRVWIE